MNLQQITRDETKPDAGAPKARRSNRTRTIGLASGVMTDIIERVTACTQPSNTPQSVNKENFKTEIT